MLSVAPLLLAAFAGALALALGVPARGRIVVAALQVVLLGAALLLAAVVRTDPGVLYLLGATALAAAVLGSPVVRSVLTLAERMQRGAAIEGLPFSAWIGAVERFAFTLALLLGVPEIAAAVLAVKGFGVYAESRAAGEGGNLVPATRVLGSLASFGWALACSAVVQFARTRG